MRGHNAQAELAEAELNLTRARAAAAEEQREKDRGTLREAVAQGRTLKTEYHRLEGLFRQAEQRAIRNQLGFSSVNQALAHHIAAKPDDVEDFPTPEEEAAWEHRAEGLRAEHSRILAELNAQGAERDRLRLDALRAFNAMEQQRHAVRNLKNRVLDPEGEWMRRGVSPVDGLPNL